MTNETFEKASEIVQKIGENRRTIEIIERMLEKFHDRNYPACITVSCRVGQYIPEDVIRHSDFPELYDALKKALERVKFDLKQNREKLEAL